MTMKDIIDVSRYQGTIDWDKLAGKIGGAMLKTVSTNKSFGGIYIDPQFERNYAACKRLGIPVGVYYYTYAQDAATVQAELGKLHEALTGKSLELPVAVDVEDNKLKPLSADALTDLVIDAAAAPRRTPLRAARAGWAGGAARAEEILRAAGIAPSARGETLEIEQFRDIARAAQAGECAAEAEG